MVGVPEIEFRVDACLPRRVQEIRDQRKQILSFLVIQLSPR
jgi:hypothetical protein